MYKGECITCGYEIVIDNSKIRQIEIATGTRAKFLAMLSDMLDVCDNCEFE